MSKINQIQKAILSLDPGSYQKLMDAFIMKKYNFTNITPLGSHSGTDKITKGTPDSFVRCDDGHFILIAHGTVDGNAFCKVESDILKCLDESKTGIELDSIFQIICCHTSTNFNPGQVKQLCSHFHNTILIGLGEVSHDLYLKYPNLAHDHLNVNMDTHQIFDSDSYIKYVSQNPYSTPMDRPLLCREEELANVEALLNKNQIVLILGASGVGKTRLALEVAQKYVTQDNYVMKVIRSNGESIYEDIKSTFTDDSNYVVLVDDADQLIQLNHLLEICVDSTRQHQMKVILTVRDYAREKLIQTVKSVSSYALCELNILSDDSISHVLSENMKIKNIDLIKHIQQIAKGNIRLAIMAGICALNGNFDVIRNSFDIFNDYYSRIIGSMDRDELMIASLIAFFDSFELKETELPFSVALQQGIDNVKFIKICDNLHKREVVDIFDNKAVKFGNQNLRDYLLYYVFFKEKWLSPSNIIECAFPVYRQKIIFAFNTLMKLFYTEEHYRYIENEISTTWRKIKNNSGDTAFKFIQAFHLVIPDESLLYIKQRIDVLPEIHKNLDEFDFEKRKNHHTIHSEVINILIGFKNTSRFKDAIQLALFYFEKNTEYPMDIYFLFGESWGIGQESLKFKYAQEYLMIEVLTDYYKEKKSILSATALVYAASYSLRLEFSETESNRNNTVTFCQFGIPACDEIYRLRSSSLHALSLLFETREFRKCVIKELLDYPSFARIDSDTSLFEHDLNMVARYFGSSLTVDDFEICKILDHFYTISQRAKIPYPDGLPRCEQNEIYKLYKSLKKDSSLKYENWDKEESIRRERIEKLCESTSDVNFARLWKELENERLRGIANDSWEVSTGVDLIFTSLSESDTKKFISCCESYMKHQTPYGEKDIGVINGLNETLGYVEAIKFVKRHEFKFQARWLASIYNLIPNENIDDMACSEILEFIASSNGRGNYTVSLETVLRINSLHPGFLVKYVSKLNSISSSKPYLMSEFIRQITRKENLSAGGFVSYFYDDIEILTSAYINAFHGYDYFDHKGELLIQIIQFRKPFLPVFIKEIMTDSSHKSDISSVDILWEQDDYLELISVAIDTLREEDRYSFAWNKIGEGLLSHVNNDLNIDGRKDKWIAHYINKHSSDRLAMKFLFGILCNGSEERLLNSIALFCNCNNSFMEFCEIQITPTHMSWSGSEVPIIEKQIGFLEKLRASLNSFEFIEHRERISTYIQNSRQRIERILLDEFLEVR